MTYIKSMDNDECNQAIIRCFDNIKINEIKEFIENIECVSQTRKKFYQEIIDIRYNIIKDIYNKLQNNQFSKNNK